MHVPVLDLIRSVSISVFADLNGFNVNRMRSTVLATTG